MGKWLVGLVFLLLIILIIVFLKFCTGDKAFKADFEKAPKEFFLLYNEGKLVKPKIIWGSTYNLDVSGLYANQELSPWLDQTELVVFEKQTNGWVESTAAVNDGVVRLSNQTEKVLVPKSKGVLLEVYEYLAKGYSDFQNGEEPELDKQCNEVLMAGVEVIDDIDFSELVKQTPFKDVFNLGDDQAYETICHTCIDFGIRRHVFPVMGNHEKGLAFGITPAYEKLVNMIPQTLSCEHFNDKEPYFFSNRDGSQLFASVISMNINPEISNGPLYTSIDGGETWEVAYIVKGVKKPSDITTVFAAEAITAEHEEPFISSLLKSRDNEMTNHFTMAGYSIEDEMDVYRINENYNDQPHLAMEWVGDQPLIVMGYNDLEPGRAAYSANVKLMETVNRWHTINIAERAAFNNYAASVRPAIAKDGTVYVAMVRRTSAGSSVLEVNRPSELIVVREDYIQPSSSFSSVDFGDLVDPSDGKKGKIVGRGDVFNSGNNPSIGNHRTGGHLSLAVNPNNSNEVYVAWANVIGAGRNNMHVWKSNDRGENWKLITTFTNVVAPALAVSDNGTVGFLYHQLSGHSKYDMHWKVKLWQWNPSTTKSCMTLLANPIMFYSPSDRVEDTGQPILGEYAGLDWSNGTFKGVFIGNNYGIGNTDYYPKLPKTQRAVKNGEVYCDPVNEVNGFQNSWDPFYFEIKSI
ncbi:MAG: exo-alpha-sialidase [Bacteroidetes bacterium]|nr:exo-alpha-sialidase [Bacteroidota bacterium]